MCSKFFAIALLFMPFVLWSQSNDSLLKKKVDVLEGHIYSIEKEMKNLSEELQYLKQDMTENHSGVTQLLTMLEEDDVES
ncbi:MAG: hypothetical protein K9H26_04845 [Prolixibacteraceae bacterium]|nr:hypothetical protein [Prolixibacteraceae bacterium]